MPLEVKLSKNAKSTLKGCNKFTKDIYEGSIWRLSRNPGAPQGGIYNPHTESYIFKSDDTSILEIPQLTFYYTYDKTHLHIERIIIKKNS